MAEETHVAEPSKFPNKRKLGMRKASKSRKKPNFDGRTGNFSNKPKKVDRKMRKLFRKRARAYNSDEDEDEDEDENSMPVIRDDVESEKEEEVEEAEAELVDGSRAFRMAFKSIINKMVPHDILGPVMSAHKKLIGEKLAEEEAERKFKGEAKKEKQLLAEKGHVKPANYLDSQEKFLIGVATKGVVKLFNAVNKAQHAQKGLDPSRSKDAKAIRKRRKEAFFSELGKTSKSAAKGHTSKGKADGEGPAWAPLRDNYMLTNSKLKDWDKMPETTVADDFGRMSEDSSSDDD
uniref:RRP15-like protein n=1 Tax=Fagus sylvatica TaxID=28930 RepID=A0A2N9EJ29_FAGSY